MKSETTADVRNKPQPAMTVLERIRDKEEVSKEAVDVALGDLEKGVKEYL